MSTLRWSHLRRTAGTGARFQHFFLPEDPDEAHLALVHLGRMPTILRHEGAGEGGTYDQARLHDLVADEGFSHHPVHGSAPGEGWMASYHADEGDPRAVVHHISSITPGHIAEHRGAIAEHLAKPSSYQGGWHDTSSGDVYLDASKHFPENDEHGVRSFAADNHQKAYFHLGTFTERFMDPKQDPLAMKDRDAWHERYSGVGTAPHPRWHEYAHKYPNTPEQDEHFRLHPLAVRSKASTPMAGRPIGAFRANPDIQRRLARYQDR